MSYRIEVGQPLSNEVRRIATDELDAAIELLADPDQEGLEKSVHSVRKHTKRLRSLIRIVRPALGTDFATANRTIRESSAVLSPLRDAHALLATFDALAATQQNRFPGVDLSVLRAALATNAATVGSPDAVATRIDHAKALLIQIREDVKGWSLPKRLDLAIDGAAQFYGQARGAFKHSVDKPSEVRMHEWRKRVKDNWYHTQLLREIAPTALKFQQEWLNELSDALGDHNDLCVLTHLLESDSTTFPSEHVEHAMPIIVDVRSELVNRSHRSGSRLYAESERSYHKRLHHYAAATKNFGAEHPLGDVKAIYATT